MSDQPEKEERSWGQREPNAFQKWIDLSEAVDAWRPWPRFFISVYMYMLYRTTEWFLALPTPTVEQAGFVSVIVGVGAAWFGLYVNSGRNRN